MEKQNKDTTGQHPEEITEAGTSRAAEFNRKAEAISQGIEELRESNKQAMREVEQLGADQDKADEEADKIIAGLREAIASLKEWKRERDSAALRQRKSTEPEPEGEEENGEWDIITPDNTDIEAVRAMLRETRELIKNEKPKP